MSQGERLGGALAIIISAHSTGLPSTSLAIAGTATSQSIESFRKTDINKSFDKQSQDRL
jgi:hypothetical protein